MTVYAPCGRRDRRICWSTSRRCAFWKAAPSGCAPLLLLLLRPSTQLGRTRHCRCVSRSLADAMECGLRSRHRHHFACRRTGRPLWTDATALHTGPGNQPEGWHRGRVFVRPWLHCRNGHDIGWTTAIVAYDSRCNRSPGLWSRPFPFVCNWAWITVSFVRTIRRICGSLVCASWSRAPDR